MSTNNASSVSQKMLLLSFAALACLAWGTRCSVQIVDLDCWHEMAVGQQFIETGQVPTEDIFAFIPTVKPSRHHEWLFGVLLYFLVDF